MVSTCDAKAVGKKRRRKSFTIFTINHARELHTNFVRSFIKKELRPSSSREYRFLIYNFLLLLLCWLLLRGIVKIYLSRRRLLKMSRDFLIFSRYHLRTLDFFIYSRNGCKVHLNDLNLMKFFCKIIFYRFFLIVLPSSLLRAHLNNFNLLLAGLHDDDVIIKNI